MPRNPNTPCSKCGKLCWPTNRTRDGLPMTCQPCGGREVRRAPLPDACGTLAGYFRHRRRGQETCQSCRDALSAYTAAKRGSAVRFLCAGGCGKTVRKASSGAGASTCNECRGVVHAGKPRPAPKPAILCKACGLPTPRRRAYCSDECYLGSGLAQRGALRVALEADDHAAVLHAIRGKCAVDPISGCWTGFGRLKDGYPTVNVAGRSYLGHRLSLEAKLGKPLGKQAAHHMCANSACVNPDHLQPVTARENAAEMLARTYMESRIADLESALAAHEPDHPLLAEVGVVAA